MNKFHYKDRYFPFPDGRFWHTIFFTVGIFVLLVTVASAQGPDRVITGDLHFQSHSQEGVTLMQKSTIHELITTGKEGRDDDDDDFSGTCTIIPWLCGFDFD